MSFRFLENLKKPRFFKSNFYSPGPGASNWAVFVGIIEITHQMRLHLFLQMIKYIVIISH